MSLDYPTACDFGESYILASYSKFKSKAAIKAMLAESPDKKMNPPVDFKDPVSGRYATPEEIRKFTGATSFTFTIQKNGINVSYGAMSYNPKTGWSVK